MCTEILILLHHTDTKKKGLSLPNCPARCFRPSSYSYSPCSRASVLSPLGPSPNQKPREPPSGARATSGFQGLFLLGLDPHPCLSCVLDPWDLTLLTNRLIQLLSLKQFSSFFFLQIFLGLEQPRISGSLTFCESPGKGLQGDQELCFSSPSGLPKDVQPPHPHCKVTRLLGRTSASPMRNRLCSFQREVEKFASLCLIHM